MRYVFAALIAAFILVVDPKSNTFNNSDHQSFPSAAMLEAVEAHTEQPPSEPSLDMLAEPEGAVALVVGPKDNMISTEHDITASAQDQLCEVVKNAADESRIPVGFFMRLLWQESRFRSEEVSSAGAQGIAQFMPTTAAEMGLNDPFDPRQAIPASARLLRRLHVQFGNLGLAAAAYNAGGGRIAKWLSRRASLPKETRAYVRIITGVKPEEWTAEAKTVSMQTGLPKNAPCEEGGNPMTEVTVALSSFISDIIRKAEGEAAEIKENALRKARKVSFGKFDTSPTSRPVVIPKINKTRIAATKPNQSPKLAAHPAVRLASATAR